MLYTSRTVAASIVLLSASLMLGACTSAPISSSDSEHDAAAKYCVENGGVVQERQPTFGTNNDKSTWVELGEPVEVCQFRTGEGDSATAIYVDLATLHSEKPTLAALAYLKKAPVPAVAPANPASQLCVDLGGAVNYGTGAAGGGLVLESDPIDILSTCVFADGSFIDEWGIAYYSTNTVRGIDLAPLFRFDSEKVPDVFPG